MPEATKPRGVFGWPSWLVLAGLLALSAGAASLGGLFAPDVQYQELNKPSWTPPGWLFGPVWTVLYTAMAVAAWRVWKRGVEANEDEARAAIGTALIAYLVQLALNAIWSPLFFGLGWLGIALIEILIMLAAIIITTRLFARHDMLASWLMAPYIAWVSFASFLNATIWYLNH